MRLSWPQDKSFLLLPVESGAPLVPASFWAKGRPFTNRRFPLACHSIDQWVSVERSWLPEETIEIELPDTVPMAGAASFSCEGENNWRQPFPLVMQAGSPAVYWLEKIKTGWRLGLNCELLGTGAEDLVVLESRDLIFWERVKTTCCTTLPQTSAFALAPGWKGALAGVLQSGEDALFLPFLHNRSTAAFVRPVPALPMHFTGGAPAFTQALSHYRVFERHFEPSSTSFEYSLSFRAAPDIWPDIRLLPAEGTRGDISAQAFEVKMTLSLPEDASAELSIGGYTLHCTKAAVRCGEHSVAPMRDAEGRMILHFVVNEEFLQLAGGAEVLLATGESRAEARQTQVIPITENIAHCRVEERPEKQLCFKVQQGEPKVESLTVFGLRPPRWSEEAAGILEEMPAKGELLYSAPHYRVFAHAVEDERYGPPAAFVPDRNTVLSPQRVCEEFAWRENNLGDMVRATNRSDVWCPSFSAGRYPTLHSGAASVDAAYNIALDTFALNTDGVYSLPGQEKLWNSGFFQGEGQGFGVWLRDSAHVAMRGGNLIDPARARRTLLYTVGQGFDNGHDGPAMAVVGLWDYYLATGDASAIYEAWPALCKTVGKIDALYDQNEQLVRAPTATSNDCFEEPENGGFALGGVSYYMLAYEGMAKMAALTGLNEKDRPGWEARAAAMRESIQRRYWNEATGYFTSGPKGTPAYEKAFWETSGAESTVWSRFGIATPAQKQMVLQKLRKVALSEYGIILYPYKEKVNHFTGSVWGVWQAGFANAAAETGDISLLEQMFYGQVRAALLNKTFYEVIDADSGIVWRWPGQLWHAAGFISLLYYGVFGMRYDQTGLHFSPAVPGSLANIRLEGLCYQQATLDIWIRGAGTSHRLFLDGRQVEQIPLGLQGHHRIELLI